MVGRNAASRPPVFVLGTGRCGSTMVSNILNRHPRVLSLSELFSYLGMRTFRRRRPTGEWMWDLCSNHRTRTGLLVREDYEELLYPFGAPNARYTRDDVPPLLCAALPHLTDEHEALFEEIGPVVRGQPRQPLADHFQHLFGWLCTRFDRDVWVERSGGSLLFASALLRRFSDARVIHVYRDGRETAISMSRHYPFRMLVASLRVLRSRGVDVMALISRDRLWDLVNPWMEPVVNAFIKPEHLPYDQLTIADFATLWNVLIAKGHRLFADLPPDRLLNLRFEDVQADPEAQIRRLVRFADPALEDEDMAARGLRHTPADAVEVRTAGGRRARRHHAGVPSGSGTSRLSALNMSGRQRHCGALKRSVGRVGRVYRQSFSHGIPSPSRSRWRSPHRRRYARASPQVVIWLQ